MTRTHGRCARGQRLIAKVPQGRRETLTFIAALRCDGLTAPCLLDGPIDADSFLAWIEQMLAPALLPGYLVIMDNLPAHKVAGVKEAIAARGAKLRYLPAYSPDLNPIENAFAKLKAHVRKAAARTFQALEMAAANALRQFAPAECLNFFAHAGYGSD